MAEKRTLTMIVAETGPLRTGLKGLMEAIPGARVVGEAEDAASALRIAEECGPDLVLLDATLPGGAAWTILRQIRTSVPRARLLVLVADAQQQRTAAALGADAALLKGVQPARLMTTIEDMIRQRRE